MEKVSYGRFTVYTSDIEKLSQNALNSLNCGDCVIKETTEGGKLLLHCYIVTHKQETGICMSYFNAGYLETISYDKIDGVWTFNSKDVWSAE